MPVVPYAGIGNIASSNTEGQPSIQFVAPVVISREFHPIGMRSGNNICIPYDLTGLGSKAEIIARSVR
jgi:hypothetical protein